MSHVQHILILDDDEETAELLAALLSSYLPRAGITVAHSGEEAVFIALKERPSAAIFDLEMPGIGGEEAANALRAAYAGQRLLLIAMSGNVIRLETLRLKGPFDHLLSKPVDIEALVALFPCTLTD